MAFSNDDVSVTMRGDEWFAMLSMLSFMLQGRTADQAKALLSTKGVRKFEKGKAKLESQLLAASALSSRKRGPANDDDGGTMTSSMP